MPIPPGRSQRESRGCRSPRPTHRRAKRTVSGVRFNQPGDVATVLRVLYLVFNEGHSGDVDLAAEAIRLTRQLAAKINHEEIGRAHV